MVMMAMVVGAAMSRGTLLDVLVSGTNIRGGIANEIECMNQGWTNKPETLLRTAVDSASETHLTRAPLRAHPVVDTMAWLADPRGLG